ncbi:unnamed protein product [Cyprideis torosa]|uniref:Uncharacterized protein n=1 Tax=Cyprideis torosa TaxID=163714 RepID=A0A7R8W617_9CRUS|nr:unnamed protein product [Cyprideis torosa]CAG0884754.1 unnamed protein product [Cyprideis torosa]
MIAEHLQEWRLCHVNSEFQICSSYPPVFCVPKGIEDRTVIEACSFRQGGRLPILSYLHKGKACLLRASQPMIGPQMRRNKADERILSAALSTHSQGQRGYIVDTRTQSAAVASRSRGGGIEMETFYPQWRRMHKGIEKKAGLMDSLNKLVEACNDVNCSSDKWLSRLESSGWMSYIEDVLMTACLVAQCLEVEGASVLVHGTEGTDSTLLVTSLVQIILNQPSRTIRGFQALVEMEWILGGHPFRLRHCKFVYAPSSGKAKASSPVFLAFLDCVWQIMQQFPTAFEFTEDFLLTLLDHSYASQFGTFLANSPRERTTLNLSDRTGSLWSHLSSPRLVQEVANPLYVPQEGPIWPSVAPVTLELCSAIFLRWIREPTPQKEALRAVHDLKKKEDELRLKAQTLRETLTHKYSECAG